MSLGKIIRSAGPRPTFGNYDLFTGTLNEEVEQFVIRYSVNGQTFPV
jgi:hypothetical protein